ncbi:MAG: hypothetical protein JST89_24255 [Cyanobacteria bacterium SZAS-4]|nr:hypothetical protein [Cyanobacteria bacterium SZAS-4]
MGDVRNARDIATAIEQRVAADQARGLSGADLLRDVATLMPTFNRNDQTSMDVLKYLETDPNNAFMILEQAGFGGGTTGLGAYKDDRTSSLGDPSAYYNREVLENLADGQKRNGQSADGLEAMLAQGILDHYRDINGLNYRVRGQNSTITHLDASSNGITIGDIDTWTGGNAYDVADLFGNYAKASDFNKQIALARPRMEDTFVAISDTSPSTVLQSLAAGRPVTQAEIQADVAHFPAGSKEYEALRFLDEKYPNIVSAQGNESSSGIDMTALNVYASFLGTNATSARADAAFVAEHSGATSFTAVVGTTVDKNTAFQIEDLLTANPALRTALVAGSADGQTITAQNVYGVLSSQAALLTTADQMALRTLANSVTQSPLKLSDIDNTANTNGYATDHVPQNHLEAAQILAGVGSLNGALLGHPNDSNIYATDFAAMSRISPAMANLAQLLSTNFNEISHDGLKITNADLQAYATRENASTAFRGVQADGPVTPTTNDSTGNPQPVATDLTGMPTSSSGGQKYDFSHTAPIADGSTPHYFQDLAVARARVANVAAYNAAQNPQASAEDRANWNKAIQQAKIDILKMSYVNKHPLPAPTDANYATQLAQEQAVLNQMDQAKDWSGIPSTFAGQNLQNLLGGQLDY